jgi:hypothetical protein
MSSSTRGGTKTDLEQHATTTRLNIAKMAPNSKRLFPREFTSRQALMIRTRRSTRTAIDAPKRRWVSAASTTTTTYRFILTKLQNARNQRRLLWIHIRSSDTGWTTGIREIQDAAGVGPADVEENTGGSIYRTRQEGKKECAECISSSVWQ